MYHCIGDAFCFYTEIYQADYEQWGRNISNIRRAKYQKLNDSRPALQLSLPNPLNPDVKLRMKM